LSNVSYKLEDRIRASLINCRGNEYERITFKTHFIERGEDIVETVRSYLDPHLQEGDYIFISDKAVSHSQKRSIHEDEIKPGFLAKLLYRFVKPTRHGRGIGTPEKMEMAIRSVGAWRIILAAIVSAVTKIFGLKGYFYKVAGGLVRAIDGQSGGIDGPYYHYIILPTENPDSVARRIQERTGCQTIIADINDLGGHIVGYSSPELKEIPFTEILKDNPMGQDNIQTPIGIIRKINNLSYS